MPMNQNRRNQSKSFFGSTIEFLKQNYWPSETTSFIPSAALERAIRVKAFCTPTEDKEIIFSREHYASQFTDEAHPTAPTATETFGYRWTNFFTWPYYAIFLTRRMLLNAVDYLSISKKPNEDQAVKDANEDKIEDQAVKNSNEDKNEEAAAEEFNKMFPQPSPILARIVKGIINVALGLIELPLYGLKRWIGDPINNAISAFSNFVGNLFSPPVQTDSTATIATRINLNHNNEAKVDPNVDEKIDASLGLSTQNNDPLSSLSEKKETTSPSSVKKKIQDDLSGIQKQSLLSRFTKRRPSSPSI
jgi:hypothetical protein